MRAAPRSPSGICAWLRVGAPAPAAGAGARARGAAGEAAGAARGGAGAWRAARSASGISAIGLDRTIRPACASRAVGPLAGAAGQEHAGDVAALGGRGGPVAAAAAGPWSWVEPG